MKDVPAINGIKIGFDHSVAAAVLNKKYHAMLRGDMTELQKLGITTKTLPGQIAEIEGANMTIDLKGSANDLLYAAKEATKVKNKQVVEDIYNEMVYRQERRIMRGKSINKRLNQYVEAVLEYKKSLEA